jgi:hypothetical protein
MSDLDISLIYRTSFVNQWSTVNTLLAHLTIEYDVLDTIDRASDALDLITLEDIVLVMDCIRIVMPIAIQKDDSLGMFSFSPLTFKMSIEYLRTCSLR